MQTLENNPAIIHGGPFANIAHGCNSVIATKLAMRLSEYTVTEAGFGADLGAEKFLNIKCRKAGIKPDVVVIVATVRALKMHGGVDLKELTKPNVDALDKGVDNLKKHIENIHRFGLPVVVAVNSFTSDTDEEIKFIQDKCAYLSVKIVQADHWAQGGGGAADLAQAVVEVAENTKTDFTLLYPNTCTLWEKVGIICREIYGATDVLADKSLRAEVPDPARTRASASCPSAWPRPSTRFRPTPASKVGPRKFDVPLRDMPRLRRGRLRRRPHRRHHDHARTAQGPRRRSDRHRRERRGRGAVLTNRNGLRAAVCFAIVPRNPAAFGTIRSVFRRDPSAGDTMALHPPA